MTSLAQPSLAPLDPGDDHLGIQLDLHPGLSSRLGLRAVVLGALCLELLLCLCQSGSTPLAGAQVLGQLITTSLSVELVLRRVYL